MTDTDTTTRATPFSSNPSRLIAKFDGSVFVFQRIFALVLIALSLASIREALAINPVLDINGTFPYLLASDGKIIEPRDYMDFDNIYTPNATYKIKQTAQGRNYHLMKAFDFANYFQTDYWHYSSRDDLIKSAQPVAHPGKCELHLNWLETQLNRSTEGNSDALFHPGEQHINLMTLMDSFGRPHAATYWGHSHFTGSYHECLRVSLDTQQYEHEECLRANNFQLNKCNASSPESNKQINQMMKFRYCVGKARDIDWPTDDNYVPRISYKIGLCLPETCETLSYERHSHQIERLMRFNLPAYHRQRLTLNDIYCLPDDRSPIRQLSSSARIFITLCLGWLGLMVFATCVYSCYKRHQRDMREISMASGGALSRQREVADLTAHKTRLPLIVGGNSQNGLNATNKTTPTGSYQLAEPTDKYPPLLQANGGALHVKPAMLLQISTSPEMAANGAPISAPISPASFVTSPLHLQPFDQTHHQLGEKLSSSSSASSRQLSNSNVSHRSSGSNRSSLQTWVAESPLVIKLLRALSIKETLRQFQKPPKALSSPNSERRLRVNLNALDAIKCLCCVLVIFGHIIFIHMMHLATIMQAIELSYDMYVRTLIAFFNFVDTFFIISGMLTAYFIFKRFNAQTFSNPAVWFSISLLRLLRLSPVYILVFWFIKTTGVYIMSGPIWDYGTDKNSIKGLCINDHWWKSILYFGNAGTMQPICILPAWSIIVDSQYSLVLPLVMFFIFKNKHAGYLFLIIATIISTTKMTIQLANQTAVKTSDMAKIRLHVYPLISRFAAEFYNTAWNRIGPVAIGIFGGHMLYLYEIGHIRHWPRWMRGHAFKAVLVLHVIIFMLPTIGRYIDDPRLPGDTDTTIFILSNSTIKPIWSVINTILLLRLITDLRRHSVLARLMSHNIWHCLGKLCFTSYLIHYEVILIMLKARQEGLIEPNWWNVWREFSVVFLISTLISYIIYILYEAPVNNLIMLAFANQAKKRKGPNEPTKEEEEDEEAEAVQGDEDEKHDIAPKFRMNDRQSTISFGGGGAANDDDDEDGTTLTCANESTAATYDRAILT